MWEQYRKTIRGMQIVIGLVTMGVFVLTRRVSIAAGFFAMMQCGALVGAMWGARLKRLIEGSRAARLPARRA
jgi:hypothetical protein